MDQKNPNYFRKCPLCGEEIFASAGQCYFCGKPHQKDLDAHKVNTKVLVVWVIFMLLLISGVLMWYTAGLMTKKIWENRQMNAVRK